MSLSFFTPAPYSFYSPVRRDWYAPQRSCITWYPRYQSLRNCGVLGSKQLQRYRYRPHCGIRRHADVLHSDEFAPVMMQELMEGFLHRILQDQDLAHMQERPSSERKGTTHTIQSKNNSEHTSAKYQLQFNVHGFNPDEITVKTKDKKFLEILAKHGEDSKNGTVFEDYHRIIKIPDHIDASSLTSVLSPEGILKIEATVNENVIKEPIEEQKMETSHADQVKDGDFVETTEKMGDINKTDVSDNQVEDDNNGFKDDDTETDAESSTEVTETVKAEDHSDLEIHGSDKNKESSADTTEMTERVRPDSITIADDVIAENEEQSSTDSTKLAEMTSGSVSKIIASASRSQSQSSTDMSKTSDKFQVQFDVSEFKPDEVKISTKDDKFLEIQAEHEEKCKNGHIYKKYHRIVAIPEHVDAVSLKSMLSPQGILNIEAIEMDRPAAEQEMEIAHE